MFEQLSQTQMIIIVLIVVTIAVVAAIITVHTTKQNFKDIGKDMHVSSSYDEEIHYKRGFKDAQKGLQPKWTTEAYLDGYSDGSKVN